MGGDVCGEDVIPTYTRESSHRQKRRHKALKQRQKALKRRHKADESSSQSSQKSTESSKTLRNLNFRQICNIKTTTI